MGGEEQYHDAMRAMYDEEQDSDVDHSKRCVRVDMFSNFNT